MTYPTVDHSILPGARGVLCAGYRHHSHVVRSRVYRIARSTVYLCAGCLLLWNDDWIHENVPADRYARRAQQTRGCTARGGYRPVKRR